jgi:serine/threonine-protein kinase RsbW
MSSKQSTDKVVQFKIQATFSAVRTVDDAIQTLLTKLGNVDEITSYNVQLAAHEVCTNVVEHAYENQADSIIFVTLRGQLQPERLIEIEFRDQGRSFDRASVPLPNLDEPQEGGYGLFLAQALLDEVRYESHGLENVWRLKKML